MARVQLATENFATAGALTTPNWQQLNLFWSTVTASGGVVSATSSNTNQQAAARYIGSTAGSVAFTKAQYAAITIAGLSFLSADFSIGVILAATGDQDTSVQNTRDFYFAEVQANSSGPTYTTRVGKFVNGTITVLATASATWANSDVLSFERTDGDQLIIYRNGTAVGGSFASITDTDAALTGVGLPGILSNGSAPTGDNWEAGNVTSSSTQNLAGGATGQGSAGAAAVVTKPLAGGASGQASSTGTLAHTVPLGGSATGQAGAAGTLLGGATITTAPMCNDEGQVLANYAFALVDVVRCSDGQLMNLFAAVSTNGSGVLSLSHASLVSGTWYRVGPIGPNGSGGYWCGARAYQAA
ncbi:MAG: hypothetical protein KIT35_22040 [Piscinibacter sp.]|uniref:hypothetical protein n=1 Tax=Piscinibacter sp. TaxID=1903157 RepID=UPI00258AF0D0|nr:hypothetical protein [Piscinibacter sp.]MCW5666522.1 hypothetical protein [Piscinibacter sp.]